MRGDSFDSPIQVYCTVKQDELRESDGRMTCTRCDRELVELKPGSSPRRGVCGFIRLTSIPVIASALALSSCKDPAQTPDPQPTPPPKEMEENQKDDRILPGMPQPPGRDDKPVKKSDYPTAKRVVGRPKLIVSPYTGKHIDVEGLPAGSLAMDPTFPPAEKKYFVIPPELE